MERPRVENDQCSIIEQALEFAKIAHEGQSRLDGSAFVTHIVEVEHIIHFEWGIEDTTIRAAALLHDTIEDAPITKPVTKEGISQLFGEEVADIVEGVSQFRSEKQDLNKNDVDRKTLKKIVGRNYINPRVLILKLADRLHNMRTLNFVPYEKQIPKANETMDVYVPLAESLGMWKVKSELEDLAMKYLTPEEYLRYENLRRGDGRMSNLFTGHIITNLESLIKESGINARVETRINSLARLKHKMDRVADFAKINDMVSFRVVVDEEGGQDKARDDCFKFLGKVKEKFSGNENTERFDDFFIHPKENGYSAIQITLDFTFGAIEVAITTTNKEEFNNWGVVSLIKQGRKDLEEYILKVIFTPTGKVKFFPKEATGIDLAYSIDPIMGIRAVKLLIDGEEHPISANLPNGSLVEIILGKARTIPPKEYCDYCLPTTRKIIESQIAEHIRRDIITKGRAVAETFLPAYGYKSFEEILNDENRSQKLVDALYLFGLKGHLNDFYFAVGAGRKDEDFLKNFLKSVIS